MSYTTIDNPELYFQCKNYVGSSSAQSITLDGSEDMQPDFIWFKNRETASRHQLYDSVRGTTKLINSDHTDAEQTVSFFTSFDSDGFTIPSGSSALNGGSQNIIAWNWKAGGSASSNSDGSITSSVSANTTAGFSIVSYSGSNSNSTVGHGLGVAPKVIIIKRRNTADNWRVLHMSLGNATTGHLNLTDAFSSSGVFQNTSPTSSVFSLVGNNTSVNQSGSTYITYCFAEKKGYSKFGKYIGNGSSNGTYIHLGFRPAFVLLKRTDSDNWWHIFDNKRDAFNLTDTVLYPNKNNAESTIILGDMLSNGFKLRQTDADVNLSGSPYIYMAFAESPFVNSNGVPNNAR